MMPRKPRQPKSRTREITTYLKGRQPFVVVWSITATPVNNRHGAFGNAVQFTTNIISVEETTRKAAA